MCNKYKELTKKFYSIKVTKGLKLSGLRKNRIPKTPGEFLFEFLKPGGYNERFNTVDSDGEIVTYVNKNRSINELFAIAKTYYPIYRLKQYFVDVYNLFAEANRIFPNRGFYLFRCPDIRRIVFTKMGLYHSNYYHTSSFYVSNKHFPFNYCFYKEGITSINYLLSEPSVCKHILGNKFKNKKV